MSHFYDALINRLPKDKPPEMADKARERLEKSRYHEEAHALKDRGAGRFMIRVMGGKKIQDESQVTNVGFGWTVLEAKSEVEMREIANAPAEVPEGKASGLSVIDKRIVDRKKAPVIAPISIKVLPSLIKLMERKTPRKDDINNALGLISKFTVLAASKGTLSVD